MLRLHLIALCAVLGACATQKRSMDSVAPMPNDRRAEIDELDRAITDELTKAGLSPSAAPAEPMSSPTLRTCTAAVTQTCTDQCTLADSICGNAEKICRIADELKGADGYANDACQRGRASCKAAQDRCCGCQ